MSSHWKIALMSKKGRCLDKKKKLGVKKISTYLWNKYQKKLTV